MIHQYHLTPELPLKHRCGALADLLAFLEEAFRDREACHAQRSLVTRYSKGWCELCQRWGSVLPGPEVLEAHHVTAVEDSGNDTRSNVWILCTPCHRLVHHLRTYLGHYHPTAPARLEEGA